MSYANSGSAQGRCTKFKFTHRQHLDRSGIAVSRSGFTGPSFSRCPANRGYGKNGFGSASAFHARSSRSRAPAAA
jgi:hypothetical protein